MKTVNFIHALPPNQHKKLTRWYHTSMVLVVGLVATIVVMTFKHYTVLSELKTEKKSLNNHVVAFNTAMNRKHTLKKQEEELKQKLATIKGFATGSKRHHELLALIQKNLGTNASLESLSLDQQRFTMIMQCTSANDAMRIMQVLQQIPELKELAVLSLQPKQQADKTVLLVSMKAALKEHGATQKTGKA